MQPQSTLNGLSMYIQAAPMQNMAYSPEITNIGQTTEFEMSNMMHNQQQSLYRDSLSLSEATSICSSSDLADIPPAADEMSCSTCIIPETMVSQHQVFSEHHLNHFLDSEAGSWDSYPFKRHYGDSLMAKEDTQTATQWHNYVTNAGAIGVTDSREKEASVAYYDQIKMEEMAVDVQNKMLAAREHHQNTAPLPSLDNLCDATKKGRCSTTDLPSRKKSFCHLSREELIQRVMQLEEEKRLLKKPTDHSDGSDDEETHPCRWAGCGTLASSLDQLIIHIRDSHIGSGKTAYYCEWADCPRESKPFLKRHKMQNHMRTHTGERPFACQVEGCDKRFSRPDSLNTHAKTHMNVRPYTCPFENCSKAYFHSRSLRKHIKAHESLLASADTMKNMGDSDSSLNTVSLSPYQLSCLEAQQPMNAMSVATKTITTTNFTPLAHTKMVHSRPCRDEHHSLYHPSTAAGTAGATTSVYTFNSFQFPSAFLEQQQQQQQHPNVSCLQSSFPPSQPQQQSQHQYAQYNQMHYTPFPPQYSSSSYIY